MASRSGNSARGTLCFPGCQRAMDADVGQSLIRPGMDPFDASWMWRYGQHLLDQVGVAPHRGDGAAERQPQQGMAAGAGVRARSYHAGPGEMTSVWGCA